MTTPAPMTAEQIVEAALTATGDDRDRIKAALVEWIAATMRDDTVMALAAAWVKLEEACRGSC